MRKNCKLIKAVLLSSVLSFCWQSSLLAMEGKIEEGGMKRSAQQAGLFHREEHDCYLKDFPVETTSKIIEFLDPDQDENTLLHLSFCTKSDPWGIQKLIEEKYAETNKKEHVYQWHDNPLTERNLYIFNKRIRNILGLYINIKWYNNMAGDIDRIRFENLCAQLLQNPLFSANVVPIMYIDLLKFDLRCNRPTPLQAPIAVLLKPKLQKKMEDIGEKFDEIINAKSSGFQNEGALYFHFILCKRYSHLHSRESDIIIRNAQNTPLFRQLNGSLMRVMDPELLSLKATPGLSNAGNFAETWKKIIDLESTATIFQLDAGACSHFNAGNGEAKDTLKFNAFSKAAKYPEEELNAIKAAGQSPTDVHYGTIADVYFHAGFNATDPKDKFENFTKSAKYLEEQLKAIKAAGQSPTAAHYNNIASAYFRAGQNAADPLVKSENYTRAKEYFELSLKEGVHGGHVQVIHDLLTKISIYFDELEKAAHHENLNDLLRDR